MWENSLALEINEENGVINRNNVNIDQWIQIGKWIETIDDWRIKR